MMVSAAAALAVVAVLLAGCSTSSSTTSASSTSSIPPQPSDVVWLCRPGVTPDPCTSSMAATSVDGNGHTASVGTSQPTNPKIDCFYIYPTVSTEPGPNANLTIQPQEIGVAMAQASRFSQVCRVLAPMFPQGTLSDIGSTPASVAEMTAYSGLIKAWDYYIHYLNDGRAFVVIGHSQGAEEGTRLVQQMIDPNAALRKRMLSAILLGGNVLVKSGQRTGGYFQHIPTCDSATETSCVIAYSTFLQEPPPESRLGRAEKGPGAIIATKPPAGTPVQVACVNPAQLLGQSQLDNYFPTATSTPEQALGWWPKFEYSTPWVTFPGLYSGTCKNQDGAQWLQVTVHQGPVPVPAITESLGPTWGTHLDDVNLLVGDLVMVVAKEAAAYGHG